MALQRRGGDLDAERGKGMERGRGDGRVSGKANRVCERGLGAF